MPKSKPASDSDAKPSKGQVFLRRSLSTVGLWVFIGFAVATESVPLLAGLIAVVGTLACAEFLGLLGLRGTPGWGAVSKITVICAAGHLASKLVLGGVPPYIWMLSSFSLPLLVIAVTVALLFQKIDPPKTQKMFLGAVFGFVYTAVLAGYMIEILTSGGMGLFDSASETSVAGIYYLLFVLAATKFTDMGAYIVGTAIGKNKFIPHISPGKTWEGIVLGGFPFALLGGAVIYHFFGDRMPALSWPSALVMSAVLAAVAIVGDLAESIIKRCLEKKDSGAILPGIGGVLDLVDSVLFTAPVFYYYLLIVSL